ncbi:MAG TPA: phosphoribosylanthranilate isomerase [Alphaproteobacteria bacterium]|nr:phosphoribosylanthranilate isomerase [Alphaproteobacteria bacterium]
MTIEVKICGINSPAAARAAAEAGADLIGFVFYPPSPRFVSPDEAARIAAVVPLRVKKVGLFVDADDETIAGTLSKVSLDMLQLHGNESPERTAEIKSRFGLPVIKAVKLAQAADLAQARSYAAAADRLLFDAKPPAAMAQALPGGNALAFDWELLRGFSSARPWMLSGGLTPENVHQALDISGATAVDVSSGVEDRPGHKDPARIARFIAAARGKK